MGKKKSKRGQWSSRIGFVLAAAGSAIGLGNIWKFPYITGENGGGSFVLIYLFCIILVGFPIMIAEVIIGRSTQKSPVGAFSALTSKTSLWNTVGKMGILAGFVILSYYSVVAGWAMNYFLMSVNTFFHHSKAVAVKVPDEIARRKSQMDQLATLMKARAGQKAFAPLLSDRDENTRAYGAYGLGKIKEREKGEALLLKALKDKSKLVRYWSARSLGWRGGDPEKRVTALREIAEKDGDFLVRYAAITSLGKMGGMALRGVPTLILARNDGNLQIQMAAGKALGQVGETITQEPQKQELAFLQELAQKESRLKGVADFVALGFAPKESPSLNSLLTAVKSEDPAQRYWGIYSLGKGAWKKGEKSTVAGVLIGILNDETAGPLERYRSAQALGNQRDPSAMAHLARALDDGEPLVRMASAKALGKMGPKAESALPILIKLVRQDKNAMVKYLAGEALKQISSPKKKSAKSKTLRELTKNLAPPPLRTTHRRDPKEIRGVYKKMAGSAPISTFWHFFFMLLTLSIVYQGVQGGIERWSTILMPILLFLLIFLLLYGIVLNPESFWKGFKFTFFPTSKLKPSGVLEALGHAFFTLSLGMGAMLTYGSYLSKDEDVPKSSLLVCFFDTSIALISCLVIFPIIFAFGQQPAAGPGLVFKTMPVLFSQMPGGLLVAMTFFLLLTFAALTSAISLLEVVTSYFIDELNWSRQKSTLISGLAIFLFGLPCAAGVIFGDWKMLYGRDFFDTMDYTASNWLLPLGGLLIAIFAGWVMDDKIRKKEFEQGSTLGWLYPYWLWTLRWLVPLLVFIVLLNKIGVLPTDYINHLFGVK